MAQVQASATIITLNGTLQPDGPTLIDAEPDLANPRLIATDIQAANGVVHQIDGVLSPVDLLVSNEADDVRFGIANDRSNQIVAGFDNDHVDGNGGSNFIFARGGNGVALGGAGSDEINAGKGDDILRGDTGADSLCGGDDVLDGGRARTGWRAGPARTCSSLPWAMVRTGSQGSATVMTGSTCQAMALPTFMALRVPCRATTAARSLIWVTATSLRWTALPCRGWTPAISSLAEAGPTGGASYPRRRSAG